MKTLGNILMFVILICMVGIIPYSIKTNKKMGGGVKATIWKIIKIEVVLFVSMIIVSGAFLTPTSKKDDTTNNAIEKTKEDTKKSEDKKSQFKDFTYEEEKNIEDIVINNINIPDGSERTKYEMFKNDIGVTCKIIYSLTDSYGVIHNYDYCLLIEKETNNILSNDYKEELIMSDKGLSIYKETAKDLVKQSLKCPSTAKFPGWLNQDEWNCYFNEEGNFIIESWVDSQNGFGAMVRSNFVIEVNFTEDTIKVISIG